jgi:hypothetical protein
MFRNIEKDLGYLINFAKVFHISISHVELDQKTFLVANLMVQMFFIIYPMVLFSSTLN